MTTAYQAAQLSRISGDITTFLSLDAYWTANAANPADAGELEVTLKQMTTLLGGLATETTFLTGLANGLKDSTVENGINELTPAPEAAKETVLKIAAAHGGCVEWIKETLRTLPADVAGEIAVINGQIAQLNAGGSATPDLTGHQQCGLGVAAILVGGLLEAWPVVAVGIVLAANNCSGTPFS